MFSHTSRTTREQHIFCYFLISVGVQNNHKGWGKRGRFNPPPPRSHTLLSVFCFYLKPIIDKYIYEELVPNFATLVTKIVSTNFETSIENLGLGILNLWWNVIVHNNCSWYLWIYNCIFDRFIMWNRIACMGQYSGIRPSY